EGIKDACEALHIPVVSGNVSFYNETNGLSIYPTPIIGMVGLIEPADRVMTQWFKQAGDTIILLGDTKEDLGGTEYLRVVHAREQGSPPLLNLEAEKAVQGCVLKLIRDGLVQSAHDCSDGGLAVALAECCLSHPSLGEGTHHPLQSPEQRIPGAPFPHPPQPLGAVVRLKPNGLRRDALLFGESQSRVLVSVSPAQTDAVLAIARGVGVAADVIGTVGGERLVIEVEADRWGPGCRIDADVKNLSDHWACSLERSLDQIDEGKR
ncbi:MAG: AIR synthase-related protein, partial [Nitrospirota bacterium]